MKKKLSPFLPAALATSGSGNKAVYSSKELAGYSLHRLQVQIGGSLTKAHLTAIQLSIAGKIIIDSNMTGTYLDDINYWKTNVQDGSGYLYINFGNPEMSDYIGKHSTDLDLATLKDPDGSAATVQLTVTYDGETGATLALEADIELPKSNDKSFSKSPHAGALVKVYRNTQVVPAAAVTRQNNAVNLAAQASAGVLNVFFFHSNLTSLQVLKDNNIVHDDITVADNASFQFDYEHPTVSGLYVFSPTEQKAIGKVDNTLKGAVSKSGATVPPAQQKQAANWQFNFTTSGSDTINCFSELMVPLAQL